VAQDQSRFIHGALYHFMYDRSLDEARDAVLAAVPTGSSVLDIACGTGSLCFALRSERKCRVVGVDISLRMLEFARRHNRYDDVTFLHGDATDLAAFEPGHFGYAVMMYMIHELPSGDRVPALREALRVADRVIVVDSDAPLPRNGRGLAQHVAEALSGLAHYRRFSEYLSSGGVMGILSEQGLLPSVLQREVFWREACQMVVLGGGTAS
jgi:ubiquinone/menaquinone biosynthesis C-methylase UbiE